MKRRSALILFILVVLLAVVPANAYADPSGGVLFQILMPALAAIWGMWMIFANNIRRRITALFRKLRGTPVDETGSSVS